MAFLVPSKTFPGVKKTKTVSKLMSTFEKGELLSNHLEKDVFTSDDRIEAINN